MSERCDECGEVGGKEQDVFVCVGVWGRSMESVCVREGLMGHGGVREGLRAE